MGRALDAVWILTGTLVAVSAVGVGGLDGATDLPVARDGRGRPYVPGPTLAGVLRAALGRTEGKPAVDDLFGWASEQGDGGFASHLSVADAVLEGATVERRDGVGLNRVSGSAADNFLYSREVVGAGARLALRIEVEVPSVPKVGDTRRAVQDRAQRIERVVQTLAGLISSEGLSVGAATGRGLGRLERVGDLRLLRLDLSNPAHLAAWWSWRAHRTLDAVPPGAARAIPLPASDDLRWTFRIHWRPAGPVMVKAGGEGAEVRQLPVCTRAIDGSWRALLPGSAIRGALRAHAERIVRTVQPSGKPVPRDLKDQVVVEVVTDLFGRARAGSGEVARGALSVRDCLHGQALPEVPRGQKDEVQPAGWHRATHVAIDRWTGGALDSALFQVLEPAWEGTASGWEPLVLELDLHRHEAASGRMMALLWLVLRDLCQGWLPLGFGTRRGMGSVRVTRIEALRGSIALPTLDADMGPLPQAWSNTVGEWEVAWAKFLHR